VTLATAKAREHSPTLRNVQPVTDQQVRRYIEVWKESGFL
jgi:hypothetical protein